jgi:hypothetical protein
MKAIIALLLNLLFLTAGSADEGKTLLACACNRQGKITIFNQAGEIVWAHRPRHGDCLDFQVLPTGNILFSSGRHVIEITPAKQVVFAFAASGNVVSCRRLPSGETLAYMGTEGRIIHVTADRKITRQVRIQAEGADLGLGHARLLQNGHYLVAHYTGKKVCEYDAEGKRLLLIPVPGGAYSAERLANGNTMIAVTDKAKDPKLIEVDSRGNTVWEFSNDDVKDGDLLKFVAGFHRLPNGNILISNWQGHWMGKGTTTQPVAEVLEISRNKEIVRTFRHDALICIVAVQGLPSNWNSTAE